MPDLNTLLCYSSCNRGFKQLLLSQPKPLIPDISVDLSRSKYFRFIFFNVKRRIAALYTDTIRVHAGEIDQSPDGIRTPDRTCLILRTSAEPTEPPRKLRCLASRRDGS